MEHSQYFRGHEYCEYCEPIDQDRQLGSADKECRVGKTSAVNVRNFSGMWKLLITSRDKLMFYDFSGDFNCHDSAL